MIKNIDIHNLFGRFSYKIPTRAEGITIITGPNGFGKSKILRIINALSHANFLFFIELDFTQLTVTFDNNKKITIKKIERAFLLMIFSCLFLTKKYKSVPNISCADHGLNGLRMVILIAELMNFLQKTSSFIAFISMVIGIIMIKKLLTLIHSVN